MVYYLLWMINKILYVCHLQNKTRKKYPREKLKEIILKVAKSTYPQTWKMELMPTHATQSSHAKENK